MKKWECTICGYIHEGDEPPAECPVCGAGPEYFKEVSGDEPASVTEKAIEQAEAGEPSKQSGTDRAAASGLIGLMLKLHIHPISVHTPNGVLPLALLLLVGAMLFDIAGFELAAFYNMAFVLVTLPVVLFTGYQEWQKRYRGAVTKIFVAKITASIVVTAMLTVMVVWRFIQPDVASSANRLVYLLVGLIMLAAVGIAGHLGGKLVFGSRGD